MKMTGEKKAKKELLIIIPAYNEANNITKLLEKLPPQITETEAGPTRQFAPVPPGGIVTEPLPEIQTDWVDFYRNVSDVLNGKAESKIKISEVRRVLSVMEAAWKSSETGEAILFES